MLDYRRMGGNHHQLEDAPALLAEGEPDRLGRADPGVPGADDFGPAGDYARLDKPEAAEGGAADIGHQLGNGPRGSAALALEAARLAARLAPGLVAAIPFHCPAANAIAAAWTPARCSHGTTSTRQGAALAPNAWGAARQPPPSEDSDWPYRVWLSEVMLQQTTVAAVAPYFARFTARWPTVAALAAAPDAEVMAAWAGLGYYARARNLLACARAVVARGGAFPRTEAELRQLPGLGAYTAAAVAAIAFDQRAVVVDANVERVVARLHAIADPLPGAKAAIRAAADAMTPQRRAGDHAQAMMDLGATICTVRAPRCLLCPLSASMRGFSRGQGGRLSGQAGQGRPARTPRKGLLDRAGARGLAGAPAGQGLARRHARAARRWLERAGRWRRRAAARGRMARRRSGPACVHPFCAGLALGAVFGRRLG